MHRPLYPAIFAAIVTLILTSMMLGLQLKTEGINLTLHSASEFCYLQERKGIESKTWQWRL